MRLLPCAALACAVGLAVPHGTSFAVSFPGFLLASAELSAAAGEDGGGYDRLQLRPAVAASALGVSALLTFGEAAVGLDTGSQQAAFLSLVASVSVPAGIAKLRGQRLTVLRGGDANVLDGGGSRSTKEEKEEDAVEEVMARRKKEALSARKSWDARLSWQLRRKRASESGEQQ